MRGNFDPRLKKVLQWVILYYNIFSPTHLITFSPNILLLLQFKKLIKKEWKPNSCRWKKCWHNVHMWQFHIQIHVDIQCIATKLFNNLPHHIQHKVPYFKDLRTRCNLIYIFRKLFQNKFMFNNKNPFLYFILYNKSPYRSFPLHACGCVRPDTCNHK